MKDKVMKIIDKHLDGLAPVSILQNEKDKKVIDITIRHTNYSDLSKVLILQTLKSQLEELNWECGCAGKIEKFMAWLNSALRKCHEHAVNKMIQVSFASAEVTRFYKIHQDPYEKLSAEHSELCLKEEILEEVRNRYLDIFKGEKE